jgi:hypothetical protein
MQNLYLPVVKPEICYSLEHEVIGQFDVEYVKSFLKKLDSDNPTIAQFIRRFSKTTEDRMGAIFCGLIVYRMLESQAEANEMNQEEWDSVCQ